MKTLAGLALLGLAAAGCSNARAAEFDSNDPVTCLTIFGIIANSARQNGESQFGEELVGRSMRIVQQQGGLPWLENVKPQSMETAMAMEAKLAGDKALALFEECRNRQDAERT